MKNQLTIILLIILSGCMISKKTASKLYDQAKKNSYDVIIVPGVPYENGLWSRIMKGRVYWAKHLYDEGITKNIMFSGSAVYSPYYEAKIMALYAKEIGVPENVIFTETRAEHSTENIYYSYHKAKNLGFNKIALATDPMQSKLTKKFIRDKMDIKDTIDLIPFVIETLKKIELEMIDPPINDSIAFDSTFVSIKDRESNMKRWRGTLGKNINKDYYANGKTE